MGNNKMSAAMALGFSDGYEKAKEEFLLGHAAGYAAGYFQEDEVDECEVRQGTVYELAYAEGFIAGSTAYQLACAARERLDQINEVIEHYQDLNDGDYDPDENVRMDQ